MASTKIEASPHLLLRAVNTDKSISTFDSVHAVADLNKVGTKNYSLIVQTVPMGLFAGRNVGFIFDATHSHPQGIYNKDAQTLQGALEGLSLIGPDGKPILTLSVDPDLKKFTTLSELRDWLLKTRDDPAYPKTNINNDIVTDDLGVGNIMGVFYCNSVAPSNEDLFGDTPTESASTPVDFSMHAVDLQREIFRQYGKTVPVFEWDSERGCLLNKTPTHSAPLSPASPVSEGLPSPTPVHSLSSTPAPPPGVTPDSSSSVPTVTLSSPGPSSSVDPSSLNLFARK